MIERAAWVLLCLFVFTIPWEKTVWVPGLGTASRAIGIAAFGAAVAGAFRNRKSLRQPNLALVLAALFVAWSAMTWLWSIDRAATLVRIGTFAQLLAMMWLVWESARTPAEQRQLLHAYVAGAAVASAATIMRYAQGLQTYWRRYAASGFDPNDLGLTVALAIPMALYLARIGRTPGTWVYRLIVAAASAAILLTASRTAVIAAVLGFAFVVWMWRGSDIGQRVSSAMLLAGLILGALWFAPASSRARIATLPGELTRGTLHNRTRLWTSGVRALKQHPIIGVGSGAYPAAVRPWLGVPGIPGHEYVAHNTFLSVLVEEGLIGFAVFTLLLGTLAVFAGMLDAPERALWVVMLMVWAVGVFTLTWEHRKPTWLIFALIMTAWARAWREPQPTVTASG